MSQHLDTKIEALPLEKRSLGMPSIFAIWFACNLVTTTMLTGMLFIPGLSFAAAMKAIIFGCIVGIIPLMLTGLIGQKTGLVTMVACRGAFGHKGTMLPSVMNIIILTAWSWAQAGLGGLALNHAVKTLTGFDNPTIWILFLEAFVLAVALFAIRGVAMFERVTMVLIAMIMGAVIYKAATVTGFDNILAFEAVAEEGLTAMIAFDIVVATSLAWTPMSADYNRNGKSAWGTGTGHTVGYILGSILSFGSGVLMIYMLMVDGQEVVYEPSLVFDMIGFGLAGSLVIFMSNAAVNIMNVYSISMSFMNMCTKFSYTKVAIVVALAAATGAVFSGILDVFLHFIGLCGVMWVPIFGILIADFYVVQKRKYNINAIINPDKDNTYQYNNGVNLRAVCVFVVAAAITFYLTLIEPISIGATMPGFIIAFLGYILVMKIKPVKYVNTLGNVGSISKTE